MIFTALLAQRLFGKLVTVSRIRNQCQQSGTVCSYSLYLFTDSELL